ncbi:regulatory protein, luxR family [Gracilibacillus ureilyticus]|uniref:Regulatory protein, luxR family n=1 Tax=Gracilibacillus ureilyticus TaxID=531814 RepID=A0A1H9V4L3_9BACI|nr:LuxR C-terminal-related transcriptional regulator [Gracilibacillus ureilyticus]SES16528.1 regulatory protein, luxR family [Gracilibacillus ureilyticus]
MNRNIHLLQEIQAAYAEKYGLCMFTTDYQKNIITDVTGENSLFEALHHHYNIFSKIADISYETWGITKSVVYDLWPGVYTIITPVHMEDGRSFYIWSGLFIYEGTEQLVQEGIKDQFINWDEVAVLHTEEKNNLLETMKTMADIAFLCLQEMDETEFYQKKTKLLQQINTSKTMNDLLNSLITIHPELDFLGTASKYDEDNVEITGTAGKEIEVLKGKKFAPGEGLLGRVLVTNQQEFWERTDKDPRTILFHRESIYPKSLFCFPIRQEEGLDMLLFGGSFKKETFSNKSAELIRLLIAVFEAGYLINTLQRENSTHIVRLQALTEIGKLLAATPDYKRIIYILVDISMNLADANFSCVVLKEFQTDAMKLISRGNADGLEKYAQEVAKRYYRADESSQSPTIREIESGQNVIECPLFYRDKLLGVLCVGMNENEEMIEEQLHFLQTLSILGGVSLQLVVQEEDGAEDKQIHALFRAVEQFDKSEYRKLREAEQLAFEFSSVQGFALPMLKNITNACRLSYYSSEFLEEIIPNRKVTEILETGKALLNSNKSLSWDEADICAQVFALVMMYVNDQNTDMYKTIDVEIAEKFQTYLQETKFKEVELTLSPDEVVAEQKIESVESTIKELNLSPREQEVLDLVIQGNNNKEIAEQLYISNHTVKNHVTKIFQKLEVQDRAHAISKVYQLKHQSS